MSVKEKRGPQSSPCDSPKVRRRLYEAVAAHKADLEIERSFINLELKVLDRRIEDTWRLLEWLEQALELPPEVSTGLKHMLKPGSRPPSNVVLADFVSRSVVYLQEERATLSKNGFGRGRPFLTAVETLDS